MYLFLASLYHASSWRRRSQLNCGFSGLWLYRYATLLAPIF